ncbi:Uracil permease [Listeria monocytogenes N53-1]|nr:Uracil permease [Listeria monocytogenes]CCQ24492.1 Uracil permease [Listeria monocytogenes N53-1]
MMIENKIDLSVNRNMIIASVVLVVGIGGWDYFKLSLTSRA